MGGRSKVEDELLYRFMFPERPGALLKFLNALSPRWNITLFHYRGQVFLFFMVAHLSFLDIRFTHIYVCTCIQYYGFKLMLLLGNLNLS